MSSKSWSLACYGCFSAQAEKYKASDGEKVQTIFKEATPVQKRCSSPSQKHIDEIEAAIEAGRSNASPQEPQMNENEPSINSTREFTGRLDDFKTSSLSHSLQTQELWSKRLEGDGTVSPECLFGGLSHLTSIGAGGFGTVFHAKVTQTPYFPFL
jgi:hypothetical protein